MLVLALKAIESYCDFVTSLNLSLYLSAPGLAYSDTEAGVVYGAWGIAVSAFGLVFGSAVDSLGPRRALLVGGAFACAGRCLIAATRSRLASGIGLFALQAVGEALVMPVLAIATRHLVPSADLTLAFSLFYMAMQVGAVAAGLLTDAVRDVAGEYALATFFWSTALATGGYLVVVYRYFPVAPPSSAPPRAAAACVHEAVATMRDSVFWRIVAFSLLLTGSRSVWQHLDVSMPKYIVRTMGAHARYGDVYAINPAIVLCTVAAVQAATARYDAYDVIIVGTFIAGLAPMLLYAGPISYATLIAFMAMLSLGEVIYSPRVYEFMLRLAPRGREGVYSALASAPLFLIRFAMGASSGLLLERYCTTRDITVPGFVAHCQTLWLAVAVAALSTPFLLMLVRRWLYTPDVQLRGNDAGGTAPTEEEKLVAATATARNDE